MKKLAIVGSGSNTRDSAPWDDLSFDIWVFNEAANMSWCKRWSAVFQMHREEIYTGFNTKDAHHWEWLQKPHGKPIYMQEVDPRVPDAVEFSIDAAIELQGEDYFSATFAYMAAEAILQGYEQIHIYGIELSFSEYQYQAECWRYWIGFMKGRLGAKNVVLHSGKNLFKAPRYGYEGNFAFGVDFFAERVRVLDQEWKLAQADAKHKKRAVDNAIERKSFTFLPALVTAYQVAVQECGTLSGRLAAAEHYVQYGDRYADRGAFELAGATAQRDGEAKRILMFSKVGLIEYLGNVYRQYKNPLSAMQFKTNIEQYGQFSEEYGMLLGMYQENMEYIMKYDAMVQANGGMRLAPVKMEQLQTA